MDLRCWECEYDEFYLRYDDGDVIASCVDCAHEEVLA